MRILVFSLFLCVNFFASQTQSNSKTTDAILLVNGKECIKCTLELTREQLKNTVFTTNDEQVKITSFKVKVPGKATKIFKGNQTGPMRKFVHQNPRIGKYCQFFDIMTNEGLIKTTVVIKLIK